MRKNVAKLVGAACGFSTAVAAHATTVTVDTNFLGGNDGSVIFEPAGQGTVTTPVYTTSTSGASGRVVGVSGSAGTRTASVFVMAFRLPTLPTGDVVSAASLSVLMQAPTGAPAFNADLWGLGYRTANTILGGTVTGSTSTSTGDFNDATGTGNPGSASAVQFSDTTDAGAASGILAREKIMDNMLTSASPVSTSTGGVDTLSRISTGSSTAASTALLSYISEVYADGGASTAGTTAGYSTGLVFLRLSPDGTVNVASNTNRYNLWTNNDDLSGQTVDAQGNDLAPQLSIDFEPAAVTPEPGSTALIAGGATVLFGRRRRTR